MKITCWVPRARCWVLGAVLGAGCFVLGACEREEREIQEQIPAASSPAGATRLTPLQPGEPEALRAVISPYEENAYGQAEGKRLFSAMNCSGCHATMGGGGMGPALSDDKWIYGAGPEQIFSTIVQGRPNGMPSFANRLTNQQVWQLVSYIQALNGLVPMDAAPGRNDDLNARKPELRINAQPPKQTGHR